MRTLILTLALSTMAFSCAKIATTTADIQETAQQVGDVMASIDESGGTSSGTLALNENNLMNKSIKNTFDRFAPGSMNESLMAQIFLPKAEATSCAGYGFATCNGSGVITRTFSGCTIGSATFSGDVTLTFSHGSTCTIASGESVTRVPNFTVTGRRGATLSVSKTATVGQKITKTSNGVYSFSNDGINRKFTALSQTLFDQTTKTSGDITVTGADRSHRVLSGGSLVVTNNLTSVTCTFTPTNVTWDATTCNCPRSGSWSGTCSDNKSVTLDITGCGTANYTEGSDTQSVTFDRCTGT